TLDFEYTTLAPNVNVTLDMITAYTPELKWSAGVQYGWEIGTSGSLTARIDASYQDEIFTDPTNRRGTNLIEDYTLVNGRLTWRSADDTWETSLEVTNLTDELYYLSHFLEQFDSSGTVSGTPGTPRMWAVTIRRNFSD
ncbi:MAG: hypothetical protein V3R35_05525, partial [Woeseiaceae bacterium]